MGINLFLFFLILLQEIIRPLFNISPQKTGISILIITAVLTIYSLINASYIKIKTINIETSKVKKPKNLVLLTDIHFNSTHTADYLNNIVKQTNSLDPEIVFITGDLFDGTYCHMDNPLAPLDSIKAPVYFVTGNHETYTGLEVVNREIAKTKIIKLDDKSTIRNGLQIVGLSFDHGGFNVDKVLTETKLDETKFKILITHSLLKIDRIEKAGIDLTLSGHTHAGQIFPFGLIVWLFHKPVVGLHKFGNTNVYISPGTGTWGPPMRLGSRNEITLIKLTPARNPHKPH